MGLLISHFEELEYLGKIKQELPDPMSEGRQYTRGVHRLARAPGPRREGGAIHRLGARSAQVVMEGASWMNYATVF
jgi:hypothetical protein